MSISAAYAAVVVIWSTTPLSVVWSTETVPPILAVFARMTIAAGVGWLILKACRIPISWTREAVKAYGFGAYGVYGAMLLTYVGSQYISSGLISVLFGLTPILSGIFARFLLTEPRLSTLQWIALGLAFTGLCFVFMQSLAVNPDSGKGIVLLLIAAVLFSYSGVKVKSLGMEMHPMAQTVGTLSVAVPFYAVTWMIVFSLGGESLAVDAVNTRSILAMFYLAIFGSLLGFSCYFYVLKNLSASVTALITVITPIFALFLGAWLNNEGLSLWVLVGTGCICLSLVMYQKGGVKQAEPELWGEDRGDVDSYVSEAFALGGSATGSQAGSVSSTKVDEGPGLEGGDGDTKGGAGRFAA